MKSLGFKDGVEWVEVEIPEEEWLSTHGCGFPAIVALGRRHGVDVKRFGTSPSALAYWIQGPRLTP